MHHYHFFQKYHAIFVILKFYRTVYCSDTEACQGLHLFPLCDVIFIQAFGRCCASLRSCVHTVTTQ